MTRLFVFLESASRRFGIDGGDVGPFEHVGRPSVLADFVQRTMGRSEMAGRFRFVMRGPLCDSEKIVAPGHEHPQSELFTRRQRPLELLNSLRRIFLRQQRFSQHDRAFDGQVLEAERAGLLRQPAKRDDGGLRLPFLDAHLRQVGF